MKVSDLIRDIEAFCSASGVSVSGFGESALNDRGFVGRLRNNGDCLIGTAERVRKFMAANWPDGSDMPVSLVPYRADDVLSANEEKGAA
jgi:hypothetical protein